MNSQKVMLPPLPSGYMKSGWFKWTACRYKCPDCGVEFDTTAKSKYAIRCEGCRKKHQRKMERQRRRVNKRERSAEYAGNKATRKAKK